MQYIQPTANFSFNYATYDQNAGLFVLAFIYDVTSGVTLLSSISMSHAGNGVYVADFAGASGHSYLVIAVVYSDVGHTILDSTRAPSAEIFQAMNNSVTSLYFAYASFDQNSNLYVGAQVFDVTAAQVAEGLIPMTHVAFGVYIGSYQGSLNRTYLVSQFVFTSNSYLSVDTSRAPSANSFQCWNLSNFSGVSVDPGVSNVAAGVAYQINGANKLGSLQAVTNVLTQATLVGPTLSATLKET